MEQLALAHIVNAMLNGRIDRYNLAEESLALGLLTRDGPCFELGDVTFDRAAWNSLPDYYLFTAVYLHWCGVWGAVCTVDLAANQKAIDSGLGKLVSCWHPSENLPTFWVRTQLNAPGPQTCVFIAHDA